MGVWFGGSTDEDGNPRHDVYIPSSSEGGGKANGGSCGLLFFGTLAHLVALAVGFAEAVKAIV